MLAVAVSIGTAFASDTSVGGIWYIFNTNDKTAKVTYQGQPASAYDEYSGAVTIPALVTFNGSTYRVTSIGEFAFAYCTGLTSVTIPNSVTSIKYNAFYGCSGLTSVTIPNSVTSIGESAFSSCSGLTSVTIPNSVTSIGYQAFSGCSNLTSVTIPNSVTSIGGYAFYNCNGLTSIDIPNSVTSIGEDAFKNCTGLTSVTIPNSVTSIVKGAFDGCTSLPVIDFIRYADTYLIEVVDKSLSSYSIKEGTRWIPENTFASCTNLTSITIPYSVTSIGTAAFSGCSNLISVIWEAKNCNRYNFGNQVTSFAFGKDVEVIPSSLCSGMNQLLSITIPDNVKSIGDYAFKDCSGLTSVTIGNGIKSIGYEAFGNCTALSAVYIDDLAAWCKIAFNQGVLTTSPLFYAHKLYLNGELITDLIIPNDVDSIGFLAFYNCTSLTSVTIPNSVTSIGKDAFKNCTGLTSVTCWAITPPQIGRFGFNGNIKTVAPLYVPNRSVNAYKEADQWKDFTTIIGLKSVYTIIFKDWDGTILKSEQVEEETIPVYTGAIPTRIETAEYTYTFAGWTPNVVAVTGDATYIATYTATRKSYTITWLNEDGSLIDKTTVEYGVVPTHANPAKAATEEFSYTFAGWTPNVVAVTGDATYTATFNSTVNKYNISVNAVDGSVNGAGTYPYGTQVKLTAVPNYGYHFTHWSDGNTNNPRTFVLTQDTSFTAEFAIDKSGTCGKNNLLQWTFADDGTLTISGSGELTDNYTFGLEAPTQMQQLVVGNEVTAIGERAFYKKNTLQKLIIGSNVTSIGKYAFASINNRQLTSLVMPAELQTIGDYAFSGNTYVESIDFNAKLQSVGAYAFKDCYRVSEMTCLATTTPNVGTDALASINSYASLCVPAECLRKYQVDPNWGRFDLCELGTTSTVAENRTVTVEPTDNTAIFTWPTENNAASYSLQITKDGVVFCTLVFNSNGQLTGIAFAPGRNGAAHAPAATTSVAGMSFTVTGLNVASKYAYRLAVTNDASEELIAYRGEFATTGYDGEVNPGGNPEGIEDVFTGGHKASKILRNGQIYILRGEKVYSIDGQEVR